MHKCNDLFRILIEILSTSYHSARVIIIFRYENADFIAGVGSHPLLYHHGCLYKR